MTTLTRDELLVLLIEECSEVIHAASKCLRFGYETNHDGYGKNDAVLAQEIGDVLGIVDQLPLNATRIAAARSNKRDRAEAAKKMYGVKLGANK